MTTNDDPLPPASREVLDALAAAEKASEPGGGVRDTIRALRERLATDPHPSAEAVVRVVVTGRLIAPAAYLGSSAPSSNEGGLVAPAAVIASGTATGTTIWTGSATGYATSVETRTFLDTLTKYGPAGAAIASQIGRFLLAYFSDDRSSSS